MKLIWFYLCWKDRKTCISFVFVHVLSRAALVCKSEDMYMYHAEGFTEMLQIWRSKIAIMSFR